ncbi:MAG TPA: flagellar biosynthetic protein FliO [Acetobacteraceae bacterium]|nr:flagellar biosynthetic protein FliO [Acetobacteraceae bacterium]
MLPNLSALLSALAALAVVLVLIWVAARGARLAGFRPRPAAGRMLKPLDSIALDSRRRLHLVACQQRQVLLLTGGATDLVVGWLPDQPAQPSSQLAAEQQP